MLSPVLEQSRVRLTSMPGWQSANAVSSGQPEFGPDILASVNVPSDIPASVNVLNNIPTSLNVL